MNLHWSFVSRALECMSHTFQEHLHCCECEQHKKRQDRKKYTLNAFTQTPTDGYWIIFFFSGVKKEFNINGRNVGELSTIQAQLLKLMSVQKQNVQTHRSVAKEEQNHSKQQPTALKNIWNLFQLTHFTTQVSHNPFKCNLSTVSVCLHMLKIF